MFVNESSTKVSRLLNALCPSKATWRQRTRSVLTQVMACCLTTPSHYLNQIWLIISRILWPSSQGNGIAHTPVKNTIVHLKITHSKSNPYLPGANELTPLAHWGRVTHICVGKQTIIGSDNGLSPGRRQAIIWTNAGILLIGPSGTNFNQNSNIFIRKNAFESVVCEMASILSRPQCVRHTLH